VRENEKRNFQEYAMSEQEILEQRRQARAAKQDIDASLLLLHRRAVNALLDKKSGEEARRKALSQIDKWEKGRLCNPRYVKAWRDILHMPESDMRKAILREDAEGVSLRQNSPFGFLAEGLNR
jgi:hypothetical protein